jgi:hypothetical protein
MTKKKIMFFFFFLILRKEKIYLKEKRIHVWDNGILIGRCAVRVYNK